MKFLKSKFVTISLISIILVASFGTVFSFAASVGNLLTTPETGWQRIEDNASNNKIVFTGTAWNQQTVTWASGNHEYFTKTAGNTVSFKFYGTKFRIISNEVPTYPSAIPIRIDGINYTYAANLNSNSPALMYEKTDLSLGVHTVIITAPTGLTGDTGQKWFTFDAVDIDDTGYMVDYNQPTNLSASANTSSVTLTWDAVDGATSYTIKRSTIKGGPYTTIDSGISTTSYIDGPITPPETFYYVVSAVVNSIESTNSNEASATIEEPEIVGSALLVITLINGSEKEYDLSMDDVDSFVDWYNERQEGDGNAYYIFEKNGKKGPFTARKDYILYDKILTFEVNQYDAQ